MRLQLSFDSAAWHAAQVWLMIVGASRCSTALAGAPCARACVMWAASASGNASAARLNKVLRRMKVFNKALLLYQVLTRLSLRQLPRRVADSMGRGVQSMGHASRD